MKTKKFRVKQYHEIARLINEDWNHIMNKYCGKVVEFHETINIYDRSYYDTHPWAVHDEESKRWWVFKESWLTFPFPTFVEVDE